jgi:hypothetical protein
MVERPLLTLFTMVRYEDDITFIVQYKISVIWCLTSHMKVLLVGS